MKSNVDVAVVHVVGMGLAGLDSLSVSARQLVDRATLLVGAQRHLDALQVDVLRAASVRESGASGEDVDEDQYVAAPEMWPLGNFSEVFAKLRSHLDTYPQCRPVILATGDPLFFGLGRLLLRAFPPERLVFHPQVSAMQLAFSRLKVSWQDATLLSVHGRDETLLLEALKRGDEKIALLTDGVMTPGAIAALIRASDLPVSYQLWVCENLGGEQEKISLHTADIRTADISSVQSYAALNVVVLLRVAHEPKLDTLPLIGLPDAAFNTYPDRPALMTKREIRLLVLGAIAPLPGQVIWDIGAGTGSVSVELSRLCPSAQIYAIEKTAMGTELVRRNAERLAIAPVHAIQGKAPRALIGLPFPSRIFIGGSSGQLGAILDFLHSAAANNAAANGQKEIRVVLALATVETLSEVIAWVRQPAVKVCWRCELTQINVARSQPAGPLTRFSPLNPVTLVTLTAN